MIMVEMVKPLYQIKLWCLIRDSNSDFTGSKPVSSTSWDNETLAGNRGFEPLTYAGVKFQCLEPLG